MKMSSTTVFSQQSAKTMLYCPTCDYASRINGDWIIHINAESVDYECPNCETIIETRRDESELTTRHEGGLQFSNAD